MARILYSKCKLSRKLGSDIGLKQRGGRGIETKCKLDIPPGQHGIKKSRKSEYGLMLQAKQMLKMMYGVLERQFKKYYFNASRMKGATGSILLEILESRLDNVVYRMGFASTRAEARQLVSHKSIRVSPQGNADKSRIVNIPSYLVKPKDIITIHDRSKEQTRINDALSILEGIGFPEWINVDIMKKEGTFKRLPYRSELPSEINEQLVVELYSK